MIKIILISSLIFILALTVSIFIFKYKTNTFKPNRNKKQQLKNINSDLKYAGFAYSEKGDYFYSLKNCWQYNVGYCKFFDDNCIFLNMAIHCEPITFSYGGKRWLIEFWKGQYGITTGAEIGVYNTIKKDIKTKIFSGTYYEKINPNEFLPMSFILKKGKKTILKRKSKHWWLTGFKLGEYSKKSQLSMKIKIKFPNVMMRDAFIAGLIKVGYSKSEYSVFKNTVKVKYSNPHTNQPLSQKSIQSVIAQQTNNNNCTIFNMATKKYKNTLDKLEYIKYSMPIVYDMFIDSIYGKKFYEQTKKLKINQNVEFDGLPTKQKNISKNNCLTNCIDLDYLAYCDNISDYNDCQQNNTKQ